MFIIPVQNAYIQVPIFHGWKLRFETRGSADRRIPMELPMDVSGYGMKGYIVEYFESAKDRGPRPCHASGSIPVPAYIPQ